MANYTHNFELELGTDVIDGELEFNVDDVTSYKTTDPIDGLTLPRAILINDLFNHFKRMFDEFGSVVKIKVEEK